MDRLSPVHVQNRLMACTDRDAALALVGMTGDEVHSVLGHVSPRKASRVLEELALGERRRVEEKHLLAALQTVLQSLEGERVVAGQRSYVRPHRATRDAQPRGMPGVRRKPTR